MQWYAFRRSILTRGISSSGRALDLHSRGTGIDTRILHFSAIAETDKLSSAYCTRMLLVVVYIYLSIHYAIMIEKRCRDPGLNQGPSDLQSDALPTELSRLCNLSSWFMRHGYDSSLHLNNVFHIIFYASWSLIWRQMSFFTLACTIQDHFCSYMVFSKVVHRAGFEPAT